MSLTLLLCSFLLIFRQSFSQETLFQLEHEEFLLGTLVEFKVIHDDFGEAQNSILQAVSEIQRIENLISPYIFSSEVYQINANPGKFVKVSSETLELCQKSCELAKLTNSAFEPTLGAVLEKWNFNALEPKKPSQEILDALVKKVGYSKIQFKNDSIKVDFEMKLDFGGIGKGFAVDKAILILKKNGIKSALINAGGDIFCFGKNSEGKKWKIGIKNPEKSDKNLGTVEISDFAVATSGNYERNFVENGIFYHHILNPKTGLPSQTCKSVTVLAKTCELADALATAIFVLGAENGIELVETLEKTEAFVVDGNGNLFFSKGFKDFGFSEGF
ncbi:FAD:protein FMN transferase [bacterium]|nr:FAD:protein FMN transferase [bacterium]